MGFEDGAMARLARYRSEADTFLEFREGSEAVARRFCERLFDGIEYTAGLADRAGFHTTTAREATRLDVKLTSGEGATSSVTFALIGGAAAETDEYLMHEKLSRHTLEPSGLSSRVLGWVHGVEGPAQTFAVYGDGTWRTTGMLVEKSRGRVDDPPDVTNGFCLRIVGRMVDIASPTSGSGCVWSTEGYTLESYLRGESPPVVTRWLR